MRVLIKTMVMKQRRFLSDAWKLKNDSTMSRLIAYMFEKGHYAEPLDYFEFIYDAKLFDSVSEEIFAQINNLCRIGETPALVLIGSGGFINLTNQSQMKGTLDVSFVTNQITYRGIAVVIIPWLDGVVVLSNQMLENWNDFGRVKNHVRHSKETSQSIQTF